MPANTAILANLPAQTALQVSAVLHPTQFLLLALLEPTALEAKFHA
jgi:hypothetical protein